MFPATARTPFAFAGLAQSQCFPVELAVPVGDWPGTMELIGVVHRLGVVFARMFEAPLVIEAFDHAIAADSHHVA